MHRITIIVLIIFITISKQICNIKSLLRELVEFTHVEKVSSKYNNLDCSSVDAGWKHTRKGCRLGLLQSSSPTSISVCSTELLAAISDPTQQWLPLSDTCHAEKAAHGITSLNDCYLPGIASADSLPVANITSLKLRAAYETGQSSLLRFPG